MKVDTYLRNPHVIVHQYSQIDNFVLFGCKGYPG